MSSAVKEHTLAVWQNADEDDNHFNYEFTCKIIWFYKPINT